MTTLAPAHAAPPRAPLQALAEPAEPAETMDDRLHLEPWSDPVVDEIGHDPRSAYVEMYWLPVLGPSTTWMLRRFATYLDDAPSGVDVAVDDLARRLGIGERSGPNAPFARTVKRCVDFQMAEWRGTTLAVRRHLPPLARRHLRRLPISLQQEFDSAVSARGPMPALSDRLRSHGRRLALSLIEFGDDHASAERQLVRWGFHPSLATDCATFAALEHARRDAARMLHPAVPHIQLAPQPSAQPQADTAPPLHPPSAALSRLALAASPTGPNRADPNHARANHAGPNHAGPKHAGHPASA